MPNTHVLAEAGLIGAPIHWSSKAEDDVFIWKHAGLELRFAARKERTRTAFGWRAGAYPVTSAGESLVRVSVPPQEPSRAVFVELDRQLSEYLDIQIVVGSDVMTLAAFIAAADASAAEAE